MTDPAPASTIPLGRPLRVVGDVHGDTRAFAAALATDRFVIQLGDLVDGGPDSAGALRLMLDRQDSGGGLFVLGNHDYKLARALLGHHVRLANGLRETLAQLDAPLRARALAATLRAPLWLRHGDAFFVHGGFHSAMLAAPSAGFPDGRPEGVASRALYGQTTGHMQPDGYPERSLQWVDWVPAGLTVYCGHDRRSTDGRPWVLHGRAGGRAIFLDTGAGKGGHLSWIDLPPERL